MNLTYRAVGGPSITLMICHFNEFKQEPVYSTDRADRVGTHFTVDVTCVFNPAATASMGGIPAPAGAPALPPPGVAGDGPALSLATLRDYLLSPRGTLTVDVGGVVILSSPPPGTAAPVDMDSGPRPLSCDVSAFLGIGSAVVRYRIETTLNEALQFLPSGSRVSALVSNRWTMEEHIARDATSTLHIEGEAVYDRSLLALLAVRPDAIRSLVVPPVRLGFQRENLVVRLSSDETRLTWACDDRMVIYALNPLGGIVEIRGKRRSTFDWDTPDPGALLTGGPQGFLDTFKLPRAGFSATVEVFGIAWANQRVLAGAVLRALAASGIFPLASAGVAVSGWLEVDWPARRAAGGLSLVGSGFVGVAGVSAVSVLAFSAAEVTSPAGDWVVWPASRAAASLGPANAGRDSDALGAGGSAGITLIAQALYTPGTTPPAPRTAL